MIVSIVCYYSAASFSLPAIFNWNNAVLNISTFKRIEKVYYRYMLSPDGDFLVLEKGDFSFIKDPVKRNCYKDIYDAITKATAWDDLATGAPCLPRILREIHHGIGHTWESIECILNDMRDISKYGWASFISRK